MYVTVSEKNLPSLTAFATDEQRRFRSEAPNVTVRSEPPLSIGGGATALVFRLSGDPGQNHELIAYIEGPTKFFIVAISARSAESLNEHQAAFQSLLKSFVPMTATVQR
jgi:hypothetical protein